LDDCRKRLSDAHANASAMRELETPLLEISATEIRQRIRAGLSIRYLVPDAVAAYIDRERLYR
jgi:nicotinate-nucleotide adenylyltransferase